MLKKGTQILVTGGAGFIGGHLVKQLDTQGCKVTVVDITIHPYSIFNSENLSKQVDVQEIDLRKKSPIAKLIAKKKFDYIIHLAAKPIVDIGYQYPYDTLQTNIMGTIHVLEAVRQNPGVKAVLIASSDKAYGKTTKAYTEESPLKGDHPYDVSKSSEDLIAQAYYYTYKTPVIITRFGNVYGHGDLHFDRIIPSICEGIVKNKPVIIRSDGQYVRDYLYVKDVVDGYITLLNKSSSVIGEAFNFASNETLSVIELIQKIEKITKRTIPYEIANIAKNEIRYQHLNDAKVRKLGWQTKYTLKDTFNDPILRWYTKIIHDMTTK